MGSSEELQDCSGAVWNCSGRNGKILRNFDLLLPKFHFTLPRKFPVLPRNLPFPTELLKIFSVEISRTGPNNVADFARWQHPRATAQKTRLSNSLRSFFPTFVIVLHLTLECACAGGVVGFKKIVYLCTANVRGSFSLGSGDVATLTTLARW